MSEQQLDSLPVHVLAERLGESLCQVLVAVHTLTGCDYTSKFWTKHAGLNCVPEKFLTNFGTLIGDQSESMANAEEFLVQVLKKGSSCKNVEWTTPLVVLPWQKYPIGRSSSYKLISHIPYPASIPMRHICKFHASTINANYWIWRSSATAMTMTASCQPGCLLCTLMRMNSFQAVHVESVRGGHACVLRPAYHAANSNVECIIDARQPTLMQC